MSAGVTNYPNIITSGPWLADPGAHDNFLPGPIQLVTTAFIAVDGAVVALTADAAANATTLAVSALANAIPINTLLKFGTKKFAYLTAAAAKGATSLTVEAIPTALVAATDTATYVGVGPLVVPSGTYIGRTQAEADAGTAFGPAAAADDYRYLLGTAVDLRATDGGMVVRHGRAVKENFLPQWTAISGNSGLLAALRADYQCIKGQR